jgi:hypothetical protein
MIAIWQSIVNITLTSLLSALVVVAIFALLRLHFSEKSLYEILLRRKKIAYLFLVFLILLMPVVFSLLGGKWLLSPGEWGVYTRELLVSVVIVMSFSVTWKILNEPASILGLPKALYNALPALRIGEASLSSIEEMQGLSLAKWIEEGDVTGWYELREEISFGDGLRPRVRLVVEWLWRVREKFGTEPQQIRNRGYKEQLELLLSSQPVPSNYSDVEEMQGLSLAKWIEEGDVTGWYELREEVRFGGGLHPRVRSVVEWLWQARKKFGAEPRHIRNSDYKKQLESLLSYSTNGG